MTNLALGTLKPHELSNASALYTVTRNLGGAFGLATVATLMNQRSWTHWQALAEGVRISRPAVRDWLGSASVALQPQLGAASDGGAIGVLVQQMSRQVATMTYRDLYWLLSQSTLLALLLVPLIGKPERVVADIGH